jgi:hypothetical protein
MHARNLKTSAQLQRVDRILSDCMPHSTREISRAADVCAVNSIVDELREPKNGRHIHHFQEGKIHYYRRVKSDLRDSCYVTQCAAIQDRISAIRK